MGSSTKSGTPTETRGATAAAGSAFEGLFNQGAQGFFDQAGSAAGRLSGAGGANIAGIDPLLLQQSVQRLLNPADFDINAFRTAQEPFRTRELERGLSGVNQFAGSLGARDSVNARDVSARTAGELGARFAQEDFAAFEGARAQRQDEQLRALSVALPQLVQALGLQGEQANQLIASILQFIAPGEAIFDPGFAREFGGAVAGAAGTVGGIVAGSALT